MRVSSLSARKETHVFFFSYSIGTGISTRGEFAGQIQKEKKIFKGKLVKITYEDCGNAVHNLLDFIAL